MKHINVLGYKRWHVQSKCLLYRHILPGESRISVQARNMLGPLFLKDLLKLGFQPEGQMMFSPPSRKHLQVVLEKLMLSWKECRGRTTFTYLVERRVKRSQAFYAGCNMALGDTHLSQHVNILMARAWDLAQRIALQPVIPVFEIVKKIFQRLMGLLSYFKHRQMEGDQNLFAQKHLTSDPL